MADVTNTAVTNVSAMVMAETVKAVAAEAEVATMTNVTVLFPPLKKGGRGDLLLLSAKAKQQQIPPSIAVRSPTPFSKGGGSRRRRRTGFLMRLPA